MMLSWKLYYQRIQVGIETKYIIIKRHWESVGIQAQKLINQKMYKWETNVPCLIIVLFFLKMIHLCYQILNRIVRNWKRNNSSMKPYANSLIIWWENHTSYVCVASTNHFLLIVILFAETDGLWKKRLRNGQEQSDYWIRREWYRNKQRRCLTVILKKN